MITDPIMLFGDFNASIQGGRLNYAPAHANNPTTIADQAFTEFVEVTKGTLIPPFHVTWKNPFGGVKGQEAKLDFGIVCNMQDETVESTVEWISPLHDHARVSFTVGDTVWGNIQPSEPALTPPSTVAPEKLKLEQMLPLLSIVDETCTPLTLQLQDPRSTVSSSDNVQKLLGTRRSLFLKLTPKKQRGKPRAKLVAHRNAGQREAIAHIVSLQKALDKPRHRNTLALAAEESFHIMDLKAELLLSKDEMLAAVEGGPWRRAVETLLSSKKQFLEDTTNKQILRNRWKLEERERQAFVKDLGWARFSKEETSHMTLGEINQRTVVGLTIQELIPSLEAAYPWEPEEWNTSGTHTVMTHSLIKVFTLLMNTNLHPSDIPTEPYTGQIGAGGISTRNGFIWLAEGPDAPVLLEEWSKEVLRQTDPETQYSIEEGLLRTIIIRTSYLPEMKDILQSSSNWSTTHTLSRNLLYDTGPWDDTNRDSVIEQVYEASGLPPQACCPNLTCSNRTPAVITGTRPLQAQPSEESTVTTERYLDCFCPSC